MMYLKYYIFLFSWFGLVALSGQSAEQLSVNQKIERDLSSKKIDLLQMNDFQNHGIQKLIDFSNYLNLISDTSLEKAFREHAMKLALQLFVSPDILYKQYINGEVQHLSIQDYLQQFSGNNTTIATAFYDIVNITPVTSVQDGAYEWTTQFLQKQKKGNENQPTTLVTIKVRLEKIEKKFGDQKKNIWELFLAEIINIKVAP